MESLLLQRYMLWHMMLPACRGWLCNMRKRWASLYHNQLLGKQPRRRSSTQLMLQQQHPKLAQTQFQQGRRVVGSSQMPGRMRVLGSSREGAAHPQGMQRPPLQQSPLMHDS
jgi:hypothetical protein